VAVERYRNVIIGSGEPGKFLAWTQARLGERTIVVERSMYGGSCPNVACLPSKNVIHSAKVASLFSRAEEFGISVDDPKIDMAGVIRRKQKMIDGLMEVHRKNFHDSGAEIVMGEGRFTEPRTVEVALNDGGTRVLQGDRAFIAVGTRATIPAIPGLADAKPLTHVEALRLNHLPVHLVIFGGGYVGLEFAQAMRRLGSRVTIVHRGDRLLDREDSDVTDALLQLMQDEKIVVLLKTQLKNIKGRSGDRITLELESDGKSQTIEATDILIATGRTPNTDRLNVAKAGVELDSRGFIRVNEKLETSAPDTWAMGECAGSPQFTHVGFDDFRVVRDNLAGKPRSTRDRLIPYCLFIDPELAHVGLHEHEAKSRGVPYRLVKIPIAMVLRTRTLSETRGFAKALIGEDDRILGFTAFGVEASEMLGAVQTAMLAKLSYTALRDAIFPHPTAAEGLTVLFAQGH
jgi:pyruvate/2-oxoglutarate dehydrogenase complex dihydrolipoamide dehydrogenase (E3) component